MKPDTFQAPLLRYSDGNTRGKRVAPGMFEKERTEEGKHGRRRRRKKKEEGETTLAGSSKMLNTVKRRFVSRREGRCQSVKRPPRMKSTAERVQTINFWCFSRDFRRKFVVKWR